MLLQVAAFEFRYQIKSPVIIVTAASLFLLRFLGMSVETLSPGAGGNIFLNSASNLTTIQLVACLVFSFVAAAVVSDALLRDDETAFGPIIRSSPIRKADYVFGRFLGAFALGAFVMAMLPLGSWLGTLMPTALPGMIGPNYFTAYAYSYGLFGLPNALIITAILFAVAAWTRSAMGIYLSVIALIAIYVGSQLYFQTRQLDAMRSLADPFGLGAFQLATSYATPAELNAGLISLSEALLRSRLLWVGLAVALLGLAYVMFRFSDRGISPRKARRQRQQAEAQVPPSPCVQIAQPAALPKPRFDAATARAQLAARAGMEARHIFKSPSFVILLLIVLAQWMMGLLFNQNVFGQESYPLAAVLIPKVVDNLTTQFIVIAIFYSGDLVWRERDRRIHEIIDATPLPTWTLMISKVLGLTLVLFGVLLSVLAVAIFVQLVRGGVPAEPGKYLLWYLLPAGFDALLVAVLAVFVQALSPNKYVGWAIMGLYLAALLFSDYFGLEHNLFVYGSTPPVPISDLNGLGTYWKAAWWFRLFWAAVAALLLVAVHLLWPRGTGKKLMPQIRRVPARLKGPAGIVAAAAAAVLIPTGGWIVYNTTILNAYQTNADSQSRQAEYERRFGRYVGLPQPTVRHAELDVALYPEDIRLQARGRYRLVNETGRPIEQVHVRMLDNESELVGVHLPGARLEQNDEQFGYRIYRLNQPMQPGEARQVSFQVRRQQTGFRNSGADTRLVANGTDLNNFELAPRIGMTRETFLSGSKARSEHGLPPAPPAPRLEDVSATKRDPYNQSWITADITVSTSADQTPIAPGRKVSERVEGGRRIVRFVSDTPIMDYFPVHSGRYAVKSVTHRGVQLAVYHHPEHHWNVDRTLAAMRASLDYYIEAFGPYQFDQLRIVESPIYRQGGQSFANTIPFSEGFGFMVDYRNTNATDGVTLVTAHEISHQWWAHQVRAAQMQGSAVLSETLAQYSAMMVMKKLLGEDSLQQFLEFQLNRYLDGRGGSKEELPLAREDEAHIVYGKGALVMYLLQERLGEDAINRALRRFVAKFRLAGTAYARSYPRTTDLIQLLREEARTPEQQTLITDLFERVTLYDLRVDQPTAVRRADGRWDVTVPVEARKFYADRSGREREVPLNEPIEIGLFTADPGQPGFGRSNVLTMRPHPVRSGRQLLRFVTAHRPTNAGVDPYNLYIDRNFGDNVSLVAD